MAEIIGAIAATSEVAKLAVKTARVLYKCRDKQWPIDEAESLQIQLGTFSSSIELARYTLEEIKQKSPDLKIFPFMSLKEILDPIERSSARIRNHLGGVEKKLNEIRKDPRGRAVFKWIFWWYLRKDDVGKLQFDMESLKTSVTLMMAATQLSLCLSANTSGGMAEHAMKQIESLTEIIKSQSQTIQALSVQGRGYGVVVDAPRIIHGNKYELDPPILEACKIILALANVVKNTGTVPREEPTEWVLSVKYAQQSRRSRERHSPRSRSSDRESFVGHQASQRRRSPSSTPSPGRPSGATEEMMTPSRSNAKRPPKRRRVRSAAERPLRENHPGHITHVMRMTKDDSSTASSSHVKGGFAIESESGPSRTWKANDMLTSQSPVDSEFIYVEPMDEIIDLRDLQDKKWDSVVIDVSYLRNTARHQVSALSNPGLGANLIAEEKALSLGLKIQPVESAGRNMYVLYEDRETMKKQHITGTVHIYWWPTQPVHARPITLPLRVCRSLPSNLQQRIILGKPFDSRRKHYIKAESLDAKDTGQDATI